MNPSAAERLLGRFLPKFCLISLVAVFLAFRSGAFSGGSTPSLMQNVIRQFFTLYIAIVPIFFIFYLLLIEYLGRRESKRVAMGTGTLVYADAFDLPRQEMHGYKIAFVTGMVPTFTGVTGDLYTADDIARCGINSEHIPPVAECDCGFYAYSDIRDAQYQLSINPSSFLIDVDLFGVGFSYSRGFRAELQVVNSLHLPRRCMRCKIFRPVRFVRSHKFGYNSFAYWRWESRCQFCSYSFKEEDRLTPAQMSVALATKISGHSK